MREKKYVCWLCKSDWTQGLPNPKKYSPVIPKYFVSRPTLPIWRWRLWPSLNILLVIDKLVLIGWLIGQLVMARSRASPAGERKSPRHTSGGTGSLKESGMEMLQNLCFQQNFQEGTAWRGLDRVSRGLLGRWRNRIQVIMISFLCA